MFDLPPSTPTSATVSPSDTTAGLPLAQSAEFAKALELYGQKPVVLYGLDNLLVLRQKFFKTFQVAMVNRAKIPDLSAIALELHGLGLKQTLLLISPETPQPELAQQGALPLMTPATVAKLNLTGSYDKLRAGLHQKWRNRLKYSEAQGLRVTRQNMPQDPGHWLLHADVDLQRQRGYRSWPYALTLAYCAANPGRVKLFQAFEKKTPIAAILVLTHGKQATYHIAHNTARGKALCAHNLLMWSAMTWLASQKVSILDLGVINTEDSTGLARFKLGTGASPSKLGGTWLFLPPLGRSMRFLTRLDQNKMRT